jgi:4-diphosphocytidyl-2-C-methyl-D-erythritol kinase
MGAGSANAAAALLGLERELALDIDPERRLAIAAEVGSDVPLFLVGGSVLGSDRGQVVEQVPDVTLNGQTEIPCVVALPNIGVSTPHAFREWDRRLAALQSLQTDTALGSKLSRHLHIPPVHDTLKKLIRTYASVLLPPAQIWSQQRSPASQISYTGHIRPQANQANGQDPTPAPQALSSTAPTSSEPTRSGSTDDPAKLRGLSREELHAHSESDGIAGESGSSNGVHPDSLLELVRNGIENDFETVVFAQYPSLSEIKRLLIGDSNQGSTGSIAGIAQRALYAALSGSGSALFGLYRSQADATAAQQRLQRHGIKAIVTSTLPRPLYWSNMFAE